MLQLWFLMLSIYILVTYDERKTKIRSQGVHHQFYLYYISLKSSNKNKLRIGNVFSVIKWCEL